MRAAYWMFLSDICEEPILNEEEETRDWWSELKHIPNGAQEHRDSNFKDKQKNTDQLRGIHIIGE